MLQFDWISSLPVQRIAEALAEDASDAARLGLVCKRFREKTWSGGLLLAPRAVLRSHTRVLPLRFGALRDVTVDEVPGAILCEAEVPQQQRSRGQLRSASLVATLVNEASSLHRLRLRLTEQNLQSYWPGTFRELAAALRATSVAGRQGKLPPLRVLEFQGLYFPACAAEDLGAVIEVCASSLQELRVEFDDTTGEELLDEQLWRALSQVARLDALELAGLRTSPGTCRGLAQVLEQHSHSLRTLALGRHTSTSLLCPPSTIEAVPLPTAAGRALPRVAVEMQELISRGAALKNLRKLSLCNLQPPTVVQSLDPGFGIFAANLAALLTAVVPLAVSLQELDLSGNEAVTRELLPPLDMATCMLLGGSGAEDGHCALLTILEACRPGLTKLDLSGSGLRLMDLRGALALQAPTLQDLNLSGSSAVVVPMDDADTYMQAERRLRELAMALAACEHLRHLTLGNIGQSPSLRRPLLELLRKCAPCLHSLNGLFPTTVVEGGLSSPFTTGTFREPGARRLEDVTLMLLPERGSGAALVEVLRANAGTLRSLRLSQAPLSDAAGAVLAQALLGAPVLARLELVACGLGSNTARYLASAVRSGAACPLTHLNLSCNIFGDEAQTLLKALCNCRWLRRLCIAQCDLRQEVGSTLGRLAMSLPGLLLLDASGNGHLGKEGADAFLKAALQAWGRQGSGRAQTAGTAIAPLPGRINLRGCCSSDDTEAALAGSSLPKQLGRFQMFWGATELEA